MKFLLEEENQESNIVDNKEDSKFLKKASQEIRKGKLVDSLLQAKEIIEAETNTDYNKLTGIDRSNFVAECIDAMDKKGIFSSAKQSIVRAIVDDDWKNQDFISYIDGVEKRAPNKAQISDYTIELVHALQKDRKINGVPFWLTATALYDRSPSETAYSIKALTLADNQNLQQRDGENLYFDNDNPLKVNDLLKDGEIMSAEEIEKVLNNKQTKEFTVDDGDDRDETRKDIINKAPTPEEQAEINNTFTDNDRQIYQNAIKILRSYSTPDADKIVKDNFEQGISLEELVTQCFRSLG